MDKLQAMAVFVQIADSGSLTAAAHELDKSLPAIVRTLAALEQELQVRLLNRTTRRIALTEQGRLYLEQCRKILAEIEETERWLGNDQLEPSGMLTLTATWAASSAPRSRPTGPSPTSTWSTTGPSPWTPTRAAASN